MNNVSETVKNGPEVPGQTLQSKICPIKKEDTRTHKYIHTREREREREPIVLRETNLLYKSTNFSPVWDWICYILAMEINNGIEMWSIF